MYSKVFSYVDLHTVRNEYLLGKYQEIATKGITDVDNYCQKTGQPCYDLTYIYPVTEHGFISKLMEYQAEVREILEAEPFTKGLPHYYPGPEDIHITFYNHFYTPERFDPAKHLSELNTAKAIFEDAVFHTPQPYFLGGTAATIGVILCGYDQNMMNIDRSHFFYRNHEKGIYEWRGRIMPEVCHVSLVRFRHPVSKAARELINLLLAGQDLGWVSLQTIGLYKFDTYGVFSAGKLLQQRILGLPNTIANIERVQNENMDVVQRLQIAFEAQDIFSLCDVIALHEKVTPEILEIIANIRIKFADEKKASFEERCSLLKDLKEKIQLVLVLSES